MSQPNNIFQGFDIGCEICEMFPSAKQNHICNRGKCLGYKRCGTTIQKDVAENSTSPNRQSPKFPEFDKESFISYLGENNMGFAETSLRCAKHYHDFIAGKIAHL